MTSLGVGASGLLGLLFGAGVLLILAAGIAAVVLSRQPPPADFTFRALFVSGCVAGLASAVGTLGSDVTPAVRVAAAVPGGPWVFGLDALSAIFLLAIFGVGAASAWYGVSYLERDTLPTQTSVCVGTPARVDRSRGGVALAHLFLAILVAAMALVVVAQAVVPFLIAWEVMAIAAYVLIVFEQQRVEVRRAGLLYLVTTHAGTLALFALFALWGDGARDLTFAALGERGPLLAAGGGWVIALALLGFGLKAGMVPLHFWLPAAHAAAPSHVSALLSGVLIKMGIYGIMRALLLVGAPPVWSGWFLLSVGAASGALGVIWALAQHDIKRLLAYHSVENIGIILMGLGAGVLGITYEHPVVAVLGFAGATLHTLNHALFKSLLFLGAGSVIHATGTREIDRLGGLWKQMPETATAFLIGSAAIVGLPPLNGFVSEWLVFRSLLATGVAPDASRLAVLAAAALALIGALALACFAKVVGVIYLGTPRSSLPADVHESAPGMVLPLFALAGACTAIGLGPALVLPPVLRVGSLLAGETFLVTDSAAVPLTILAVSLTVGCALLFAVVKRVKSRRPRAHAPTWGCGYELPTPRMQYTASSFASPLLLAFREVAGVRVTRTAQSLETHAIDPVMAGVVLKLWHTARAAAERLRPIQHGKLSFYLLYIVATVLALLLYLLLAPAS